MVVTKMRPEWDGVEGASICIERNKISVRKSDQVQEMSYTA